MPYQRWENHWSRSTITRTASPDCPECGCRRTLVGWRYTMREVMAAYQNVYGLKPMGPHRGMAADLFQDATARCHECVGEGLLDAPSGWVACRGCRGLGPVFTVSAEVVEDLRSRVVEAFFRCGRAAGSRISWNPARPEHGGG